MFNTHLRIKYKVNMRDTDLTTKQNTKKTKSLNFEPVLLWIWEVGRDTGYLLELYLFTGQIQIDILYVHSLWHVI